MAKGSKSVKPQSGVVKAVSNFLFGTSAAKAGSAMGDSLINMHKPKTSNSTGAKRVKARK